MPTALGGPASLDPVHFAVLRASGLFQPEWYALAYQGHLPREADPLVHFCDRGWQEGRQPNPYFDPAWYLEQNPALRASGENPLLHYVLHGEREGRWPIAWFDPAWYRDAHQVPPEALCLRHFLDRRQSGEVSPIREFDPRYYLKTYQDVAEARVDPFEHYLFQGHKEGRNPSPGFDTRFYRERYLGGSDQENPLLHYLRHRDQPGVHPVRPAAETSIPREVRRNTSPGPLFEERRALPDSAPRRARLLAYYLPQFHAIPQNDAWWGAGFTEWANVQRGLPRFAGHYQPRIPRDLGPYTLEGTEVLRRQIAMAREAGLFAFVFYFYWFNGTRLLERPVESFLADRALDFPFCLMWASRAGCGELS